MPATTNENEACVRCKAQKQGGDVCRASHIESEYPSTSLSQTQCVALLKFRTTAFPHGDLLKDGKRLLETAMREHGKGSVSAALAKLRGDAPLQEESVVVSDDHPDSEVPTDYEWRLRE